VSYRGGDFVSADPRKLQQLQSALEAIRANPKKFKENPAGAGLDPDVAEVFGGMSELELLLLLHVDEKMERAGFTVEVDGIECRMV
jgi:hypothetical protein